MDFQACAPIENCDPFTHLLNFVRSFSPYSIDTYRQGSVDASDRHGCAGYSEPLLAVYALRTPFSHDADHDFYIMNFVSGLLSHVIAADK